MIGLRRVPAPSTLGRKLPGWVGAVAIVGTTIAVAWLERRRPLRPRTEPPGDHTARNLAAAVLSAATIRAVETPVVEPLSRIVHQRGWGLVPRLRLPPALEVAATVVLLDYTLYIWHVLTHRVPFLWRFHRVHHADVDLTASTALRFHFAEMALSVPWRAGQVLLLGAAPRSLSVWQTATLVAILFHHSNVRLPVALERLLCHLVMTPRMHGIHHSIVEDETNSNWSTIFTWPDHVHRTLRLNVPQAAVTIGAPDVRPGRRLSLREIVASPFSGEASGSTVSPRSRAARLPSTDTARLEA